MAEPGPEPVRPGRPAGADGLAAVSAALVGREGIRLVPAKDYVACRTAEGKTKTGILGCLKRYIARGTYPLLLRHGR